MKLKLSTTLMLLTVAIFQPSLQAQEHIGCAHDLVLRKLAERHNGFQESCTELHEHTMREAQNSKRSNAVYQIQVVFHVVWNAESQNLADEVIFDQMEILNQDYRRQNPDANLTREIFLPVAADTEIEFVLASVDPNGNPTNGINRVETERSGFELDFFSQDITLDEVKSSSTGGADPWDVDRYLNIWVCNIEAGFLGQIFGFAYPPNNAPNWEGQFDVIEDDVQGVVVHYTTVGSNNPAGMEDNFEGNEGGRTLTHEIGHYLGLRHTWGDGFFNGCSVDDGIEDTPNLSASNNFSCDDSLDTCDEGEDDLPDMGENYMDYNQDACYNIFTQGQKDAMRFVLENLRPGLIEGQFVGVSETKQEPFGIYPNPATTVVTIQAPVGAELTLYDLSGRVLMTWQNLTENMALDVSNLAQGMYLISDQDAGHSARLIIH